MMRLTPILGFSLFVLGCGGSTDNSLFDGGSDDGTMPVDSGQTCANNPQLCADGTTIDTGIDTGPSCENLKCQQVNCDGGNTTTVSGTVWDPAAKNPLFGVVVYVPNAKPDPITHGPVCDSCGGAAISGKPIVTALTDATGKFVLKDVPVGNNIPLVMQVGKWRRQITIPTVAACVDNPLTDKSQTRLPGKQSEGDMPLIAFTAGCDPLQQLLVKIGIDPSELTPESGSGAVRVYAGMGGQNGGINGATDAYTFWGNKTTMMKYDMIIQACECAPYPRDTMGPAYANMKDYLDAGGRVFASHYHLNFFGTSSENGGKPDMEFQTAATWTLWGGSQVAGTYDIDTTFPKGKALDDWLENLKTASSWTNVKTTPKGTINAYSVGDINAAKMGISQRWVYPNATTNVQNLSFNTPTTAMMNKRCGRVIATDAHGNNSNMAVMNEQEAAIEFYFFDLASCVIDDSVAPMAPPGM